MINEPGTARSSSGSAPALPAATAGAAGRSAAPAPFLTIRALQTTVVSVPMKRPLGTSAQTMTAAPLLLIDLDTEEDVTGHAYLFCYDHTAPQLIATVLRDVAAAVQGERLAPVDLAARLVPQYRLLGAQGIVRMALAGFDAACWDALSIGAGVPLASLLGAAPRPIRAYNSNGLGLIGPDEAADEAQALLDGGFRAVKLRLGRAAPKDDLAVVRAVRKRLPDTVALMADYNQALSIAQAIQRGQMLDDEGLYWIEEPIRHDDYGGSARVAAALRTPIQLGENFAGPMAMFSALSQQASDFVMPDLERIGGVTGWQRAAALAAAAEIEMSSHLFPEVSAHLLAATPTCHWLEYVDWADPILTHPLRIENGMAIVPERPGTGLSWNPDAVKRYRVE